MTDTDIVAIQFNKIKITRHHISKKKQITNKHNVNVPPRFNNKVFITQTTTNIHSNCNWRRIAKTHLNTLNMNKASKLLWFINSYFFASHIPCILVTFCSDVLKFKLFRHQNITKKKTTNTPY